MRVINYFLSIAETGSVSAAAKQSFTAQPSISRQIRGLEQELGVVLFEREAQGMRLTRAGKRFLPIAKDIQVRVERGVTVMKSLANETSSFVVACPQSVREAIIAPFVADTGEVLGDVIELIPDEIYGKLIGGEVDVAIGTFPPPVGLESRRLFRAQLSVQLPASDNPFQGRTEVDLEELQYFSHINVQTGSAVQRAFDDAARARQLAFIYRTQVSSGLFAQSLAAAGGGPVVTTGPPQFGLERFTITSNGEPLVITDWCAWDRGHYSAAAMGPLIDRIIDWIKPRAEYLGISFSE
nr:LysR family transcriptional regulator [Leucobacter chinensis]